MRATKLPPSSEKVRCEAKTKRTYGVPDARSEFLGFFPANGSACVCRAWFNVAGRLLCHVHAKAYALDLLLEAKD